jgi:excinuclease ABC subunit C
MVAAIKAIEAVPCASRHEAAWLERNLLEEHKPPWNRAAHGGQESETVIRLGDGPSLDVRFVDAQTSAHMAHFGPYLGGRMTRTAVRGLRRILPLDESAARLLRRDAGSHAFGDRAAAILGREPEAVAAARGSLIARRDEASRALAFELAGKIQEEIQALEWITSEQRVARLSRDNLEITGWSGGIGVVFVFRDGRLREWRQGNMPECASVAGLAQETAELACRMVTLARRSARP